MELPDKNTTCCFTGHRYIENNLKQNVYNRLCHTVQKLAGEGITTFISGGALGFDTMAAQAVLALRKQNSNVRLIVITPCRDQHKLWSESDKEIYRGILSVCDELVCLNDAYCTGCMHQRNRLMVELSSVCIAYFNGQRGGTAHTINLARQQGLRLINLA